MKKQILSFLFVCFASLYSFAQQTTIRGVVNDMLTSQPIDAVLVQLGGTDLTTLTDSQGAFAFLLDVPLGEQMLVLSKNGFLDARYPIVVSEGRDLNLPDLILEIDNSNDELFTITLSDDELNDDSSGADNISGLLSASQDIFQRAAAFEFSSSFFRVRGLNTDNGTVLMNGIEMNKVFDIYAVLEEFNYKFPPVEMQIRWDIFGSPKDIEHMVDDRQGNL
jgi:hypothetical protein